jgi:hypothetical protein
MTQKYSFYSDAANYAANNLQDFFKTAPKGRSGWVSSFRKATFLRVKPDIRSVLKSCVIKRTFNDTTLELLTHI